jgi:uncharacterized ferritin-like protein (DUF455 family)
VILRDEIGHVAIRDSWSRFHCGLRAIGVRRANSELSAIHRAPRLRGPFNLPARRAAGFDEAELRALQSRPSPVEGRHGAAACWIS